MAVEKVISTEKKWFLKLEIGLRGEGVKGRVFFI